MPKPLQIRSVPDDVLDALRKKAEAARMSLSAYALKVLERDAQQASNLEVFARIDTYEGGHFSVDEVIEALDEFRGEW